VLNLTFLYYRTKQELDEKLARKDAAFEEMRQQLVVCAFRPAELSFFPCRFALRRGTGVQSALPSEEPETSETGDAAKRSISALDAMLETETEDASKRSISALDAMLGIEPTPEAPPAEEEDPFLTVPLIWKSAGPASGPPGGGSSMVAGALGASGGEGAGGMLASAEYVGITLQLPECATPSQAQRGLKGVELDFVLDTACSHNFVLPQVRSFRIVIFVAERISPRTRNLKTARTLMFL
jgi:hypothetical protein